LEWATKDDNGDRFNTITSFILANSQLRTNPALAGSVREQWVVSPSAQAMPQMLRLAALSDHPGSLERSIEAAVHSWREGQLAPVTSDQLCTLIDAEYWVLSDDARRSGRGNVLKQTLARIHHELRAM